MSDLIDLINKDMIERVYEVYGDWEDEFEIEEYDIELID